MRPVARAGGLYLRGARSSDQRLDRVRELLNKFLDRLGMLPDLLADLSGVLQAEQKFDLLESDALRSSGGD